MIFDERFSPVVWWADELFEPFLIIRNGVIVDPKPFSFQIFFFFFQIFFFFKMFTLRMTTIFIHFDRIFYFDILFFLSDILFFFFQVFFFFKMCTLRMTTIFIHFDRIFYFDILFFSKCLHYG